MRIFWNKHLNTIYYHQVSIQELLQKILAAFNIVTTRVRRDTSFQWHVVACAVFLSKQDEVQSFTEIVLDRTKGNGIRIRVVCPLLYWAESVGLIEVWETLLLSFGAALAASAHVINRNVGAIRSILK